jgi:hypothetical protein
VTIGFSQLPVTERMVDFEEPIRLFESALTLESDIRVLSIEAPGLCGKTTLCEKMRSIALRNANVRVLRVDFYRAQQHDFLSILEQLPDLIGDYSAFNKFRSLVEPSKIAGGVDFGSHNMFLYSTFDNIVGGSQQFFHIDTSDKTVQRRLTRLFVEAWHKFRGENAKFLVIIFDTFENCVREVTPTYTWITDIFLPLALEYLSGKCLFVFSGQKIPVLVHDTAFSHLVYNISLPKLKPFHYQRYLEKADIHLSDEEIDLLYRFTDGQPSLLEIAVRNYLSGTH